MKKWIFLVFLCFGALLTWRAQPTMDPKETHLSIFPTKKFQTKLNAPIPEWMQTQIDRDFQNIPSILESSLTNTYDTICKRIQIKSAFYRYRILDNQLYTYVPPRRKYSTRDTRFEKALKTLLTHVQIPNVDFIYCQMDGLPEDYVPPDFFLMSDIKNQAPIFAQAKLKDPLTQYIVLIPDQFSLDEEWLNTAAEIEDLNQAFTWRQKEAKAFWRGAFTDTGIPQNFLASSQKTARMAISYLSLMHPQSIDAGITASILPELEQRWQSEGILKKEASKREHLCCKYLPILNGHMCTYPGYQWRLLSNSLCMKQESDQIQWFYSALEPYRHYVPIAHDMSDLLEKIQWANEHEEKTLQIIAEAQQFARENLLMEDNYQYLTLVLQRYAKTQSINFSKIKRQTKKDPRWVCIQYRKRLNFTKMVQKKLPIFSQMSHQQYSQLKFYWQLLD